VLPPVQGPPPPPPSLDVQATALQKRVAPVLTEFWPKEFPVLDFAMLLGQHHATLQIHYQASRALDPVAISVLTQTFRDQLATPDLELDAIRVPVARSSKRDR
jgi:hypothetical protein